MLTGSFIGTLAACSSLPKVASPEDCAQHTSAQDPKSTSRFPRPSFAMALTLADLFEPGRKVREPSPPREVQFDDQWSYATWWPSEAPPCTKCDTTCFLYASLWRGRRCTSCHKEDVYTKCDNPKLWFPTCLCQRCWEVAHPTPWRLCGKHHDAKSVRRWIELGRTGRECPEPPPREGGPPRQDVPAKARSFEELFEPLYAEKGRHGKGGRGKGGRGKGRSSTPDLNASDED